MRAAEDQVLNSYRWIDQSAGIVGLPIDRAMDLVAQRGLPVRANAPQASTVTVPTQSSLGAKVQAVGGPLANPTGQPMEPPAPADPWATATYSISINRFSRSTIRPRTPKPAVKASSETSHG